MHLYNQFTHAALPLPCLSSRLESLVLTVPRPAAPSRPRRLPAPAQRACPSAPPAASACRARRSSPRTPRLRAARSEEREKEGERGSESRSARILGSSNDSARRLEKARRERGRTGLVAPDQLGALLRLGLVDLEDPPAVARPGERVQVHVVDGVDCGLGARVAHEREPLVPRAVLWVGRELEVEDRAEGDEGGVKLGRSRVAGEAADVDGALRVCARRGEVGRSAREMRKWQTSATIWGTREGAQGAHLPLWTPS